MAVSLKTIIGNSIGIPGATGATGPGVSAGGSSGQLLVKASSTDYDTQWVSQTGSFGITIDGGGSAITTGVKGYVTIPYDCTITGWTLVADVSGSVVIDVWKDVYANYPPTVADTISGTEKPTLSSAIKNQDLSLSTWTTTVTAGDVIGFNVDSADTITRVHLIINTTKV